MTEEGTHKSSNVLKRACYATATVLVLASLGTSAYSVQKISELQHDVAQIKKSQDTINKSVQEQLDSIGSKTDTIEKTSNKASADSTRAMQDNARQEESINELKK